MKKTTWVAVTYLALLISFTVVQLFFFAHKSIEQNVDAILVSPGAAYWFGTDSLGRSLFWRLFAGAQVSLIVGVLCPIIILVVGSIVGFISGWWGGWMDRLLMRFCDLLIALPSFLLVSVFALVCSVILPEQWGTFKAILVLCLGIAGTHWMVLARVARSQVVQLKERPYVEAAEALGGNAGHIVWTHVVPNLKRTLFVLACLQIPTSIMYESFMSFIGLGVQAPQTSWGILIKEGWQSLATFPHLILIPSAFLFLTIWSFHIVLDEVSTDPRGRGN